MKEHHDPQDDPHGITTHKLGNTVPFDASWRYRERRPPRPPRRPPWGHDPPLREPPFFGRPVAPRTTSDRYPGDDPRRGGDPPVGERRLLVYSNTGAPSSGFSRRRRWGDGVIVLNESPFSDEALTLRLEPIRYAAKHE